jgi:hypothetical protein
VVIIAGVGFALYGSSTGDDASEQRMLETPTQAAAHPKPKLETVRYLACDDSAADITYFVKLKSDHTVGKTTRYSDGHVEYDEYRDTGKWKISANNYVLFFPVFPGHGFEIDSKTGEGRFALYDGKGHVNGEVEKIACKDTPEEHEDPAKTRDLDTLDRWLRENGYLN